MLPHDRIKNLLEFIEESAGDPSLKYMLALEYINLNEQEEAKLWMEKVHTLHPDYLPNYYHFGKLLEGLGKITEAAEMYEEGIILAKAKNDHHTMMELHSALMNIAD